MTSNNVLTLLASSVGKRVSLESREAVLSGEIHGLEDGPVGRHVCLQVRDVRTTFKDGSRVSCSSHVDHIDRWGVPPECAIRYTRDGNTVLSWQDSFCGEDLPYTLTIFE